MTANTNVNSVYRGLTIQHVTLTKLSKHLIMCVQNILTYTMK